MVSELWLVELESARIDDVDASFWRDIFEHFGGIDDVDASF
jgi:hypothetical protein